MYIYIYIYYISWHRSIQQRALAPADLWCGRLLTFANVAGRWG